MAILSIRRTLVCSLLFLRRNPGGPPAYVRGTGRRFDDAGTLTNDATREFMATFMHAFADWIERIARP